MFFGCSNSSDTPFIPSSGGGSSGPALPASVGTNELAGKTFVNGSTIYEFGSDSYTIKTSNTVAAVDDVNSAYKQETTTTYSYTYNSTTKQIFAKQGASTVYIVRDGVKTAFTGRAFSTDAELIAEQKRLVKIQYDLLGDNDLTTRAEAFAKLVRQAMYNLSCGYTDSTGATAATNEQIAKFNAARAEQEALDASLVSIQAYNLTGSTLKLLSDNRIPENLGLNEIYGVFNFYYGSSSYFLKKSISTWPDLYVKGSAGSPEQCLSGAKVYSITSNAEKTAGKINLSANVTRDAVGSAWAFAVFSSVASQDYTAVKDTTAKTVTFTSALFGTFTSTYATADNGPESSRWDNATGYTQL